MMLKQGLMILLALSDVFSMENDETCSICFFSESATVYPCMDKICNGCVINILVSYNSICPVCRSSIIKVSDTGTYKKELASLKAAVMDKSITDEIIISRYYFLPPWQYADKEMLIDIKKIKDSYPSEDVLDLFNTLQNDGFNYTIKEDVEKRREYFRKEPNDEEKIILQNYYKRNDRNVQNEFNARKNMF
ncbi:uncharacterized protein LOC126899886 [Daktulosphaira vitifoliae]|uniref:uncharacterized protein LOC126899886 n=1 Tax=Daktulosphaira vitifoliae TaxID=58002 RepID=UPI0021A9BE9A|nr:uncharacterized protein LOC126899886 [Daktulosphaira vitifoliae]XP_050531087.1 uncharacterized protein LOC126899886 [Daktulosphaira vitifoliae]XP_050531088.1 uncharacterized protein LOC126899886 [Daktulosphaira vitifoliae]XP_050531089.1 uncharacterized protein LOC126899886 [Daktulosphaira vitifoliae]